MSERAGDFLVFAGLSKGFGATRVLSELSLTVAEGEIFALLGPSGSGKTTALRLLAGFETPDSGAIRVAGEDVTGLPPARRRFGMVFQHYALFPHMTVGENVAFGLEKAPDRRERVARALAQVDLAGYEDRLPTALSGGQQQRVAVARALAPAPRVLLLDEPLSNLDPALRERTRRALAATVREVGITTVLVTHEQEEAFEVADRVGLLHAGRLEQVGTPEDLYERPASRFVAGFVGRASELRGRFLTEAAALELVGAGGRRVHWSGEPVGALGPGPAVLVVRPEALRLAEPTAPEALPGTVVARRFAGLVTYYTVALETEALETGALDALGEVEVVGPASGTRVAERVGVALSGRGPAPRLFPAPEEPRP